MKQLLFSLATLTVMGCTYKAQAQVKLGATAGAPHGSSILELESDNKALLITRVANTAAIANPQNGMIIYDLSSASFKIYQNNRWSDFYGSANPSSGGTSVISAIACNTASAGTLMQGAAASGVTQTITTTVTSVGTYDISATANGVIFRGAGTFAGTGSQDVILTATGTPTAAGTNTFALTTTPACSFTRVTSQASSGGTAIVSAFTCNTASTGSLTKGVDAVGVTQTITATVTTIGTYNISATANGVTFSGSGTFSGTGDQDIVLTATGIPINGSTDLFTLNTTPGCSFSRATTQTSSGGTAAISAITCNTASGGTLIQGSAASGVTQTLTATVTTAGTYNISATANGVTFSGSGTFSGTGSEEIVLTATGTPVTTGTSVFTLNTSPGCSFSRATSQGSSGGTAEISSFTCNIASAGSLTKNAVVTGVSQTIRAIVATAGTYDISAVANGITFHASGTFPGLGAQDIILTATGTPLTSGTSSFVLSTSPGCSFTRNISDSSSGGTAVISALSCNTASVGKIYKNVPAYGVTQTITATVVTAGTYSLTATAGGITFSGTGTFTGTGLQDVVLTASGTSSTAVSNTFTLSSTPSCSFSWTTIDQPGYNGNPNPNIPTAVEDITSPTGKVWMDRNLGALQKATGSADAASYGYMYQWGRFTDGHQLRTASTVTTLSSTDAPAHGNFIIPSADPYDWRSPQNTNLWQGVNGVNNPCPVGYRLPTVLEFEAEMNSWSSLTINGAIASPLKLPGNGWRDYTNGITASTGIYGGYWTSTVSGSGNLMSRIIRFDASSSYYASRNRAFGFGVRCIKD